MKCFKCNEKIEEVNIETYDLGNCTKTRLIVDNIDDLTEPQRLDILFTLLNNLTYYDFKKVVKVIEEGIENKKNNSRLGLHDIKKEFYK